MSGTNFPPLASAAGGTKGAGLYTPSTAKPEIVHSERGSEGLGTVQVPEVLLGSSYNQSLSLTHSEGTDSSIVSTLQELGVSVLAPAQQLAMATALERTGLASQDVRAIAAWVEESVADKAKRRGFLWGVLSRPQEAAESVRQIRAYRQTEGQAWDAHMPNMPIGTQSCACGRCAEARKAAVAEPWDHDRQCRVAWCRVNGDRASAEAVAREMGVSGSTMQAMLDRGRVLSQPGVEVVAAPKGMDGPHDAEKRVTEFRARMSSAARQPRTKQDLDFRRMEQEQAKILAGVRERGVVNIGEVMRCRHKRGALATLEVDGHIQRAGDLDAAMCQAYRAAGDADERERFRLAFRAAAQAALRRPRQPVSEAQS